MALKPQFDNRISVGTMLQIGALVVGGLLAFDVVRDQAENNERTLSDLKEAVSQEVSGIRAQVNYNATKLERQIDADLQQVAGGLNEVDVKVDRVISEQTTAQLRITAMEEEHDEFEDELDSTRALAVTVQSNANRDRAVQAERHETLLKGIEELKSAVRRADTP